MKQPDWARYLPGCPSWFPSSLAEIDPDMYLEYDQDGRCYLLRKRILMRLPKVEWIREPWTLAVFEKLDDEAMTHIRYLHWLYKKLKLRENPRNYYKWLAQLNKESKEKAHALAVEQMSEGFMRIYNLDKRKIYT